MVRGSGYVIFSLKFSNATNYVILQIILKLVILWMCHIRKSSEICTLKYIDDLKTAPITLNLISFCPLKILQNIIKYVNIALKKRVESNDF